MKAEQDKITDRAAQRFTQLKQNFVTRQEINNTSKNTSNQTQSANENEREFITSNKIQGQRF